MVNNPIAEIAEAILRKETHNIRVCGIMINPVTYFTYLNNDYVHGVYQYSDDFAGFPSIKRIFKNDMPLNKIILITDKDAIDFMVENK